MTKQTSVSQFSSQVAKLTGDKKNLEAACKREAERADKAEDQVEKLQASQDRLKKGFGAQTVALRLRRPVGIFGAASLPKGFTVAEIRTHEVNVDFVGNAITNGMVTAEPIACSDKQTTDAMKLKAANARLAEAEAEAAKHLQTAEQLDKMNEGLNKELDQLNAHIVELEKAAAKK